MPRQPSDQKPDSQRPTEAWTQHEHVAPPVQSQAQQLLKEAGSPDLARHALDEAARAQERGPSYLDGLAERWGFPSRHELLAASISIPSAQGELWWLTPVEDQGWIAWTERGGRMSDILPTVDRARLYVAGL